MVHQGCRKWPIRAVGGGVLGLQDVGYQGCTNWSITAAWGWILGLYTVGL